MEGKTYTAVERFRGSDRPTGHAFSFEDVWEEWPGQKILMSDRLAELGYDILEGDVISKIRFLINENGYIYDYEVREE